MALSIRAQNASPIAKKLGPPLVRCDWISSSSLFSAIQGLIDEEGKKERGFSGSDVGMTKANCYGQSKHAGHNPGPQVPARNKRLRKLKGPWLGTKTSRQFARAQHQA
jgi:hypothetical protein